MSLPAALSFLQEARNELRQAQDTDSDEWQGKLTVLETEVGHILKLAERYIAEMKNEVKA